MCRAWTGDSVHQLEAIAHRFNSIDQRLTAQTTHAMAEPQAIAMHIANYKALTRAGQVTDVRAGAHNMTRASEKG
jgi:hypothetical protein